MAVDTVAYKARDSGTATASSHPQTRTSIASGAAYGEEEIPKREDETSLHPCSQEPAVDDSWETFGPGKAEGYRVIFPAADSGVNAMVIRDPTDAFMAREENPNTQRNEACLMQLAAKKSQLKNSKICGISCLITVWKVSSYQK